jgi:dolichol-phosphate mannosyltransferase
MDIQEHIAVVIPCYKVTEHIEKVIASIPSYVTSIYVVDDKCPDDSGEHVRRLVKDPRVNILKHDTNQGVGGAVVTGYKQALRDNVDIVVKIDGDGQMDPDLIPRFITPLIDGKADYTKGNRFYQIEDVIDMPFIRVLGNSMLSFLTKLSSGYWSLFDPTNGYTAIHKKALEALPFDKLSKNYFFESDMLFRLNTIRAVVSDIPMKAKYEEETSHLKITKILLPFLSGHVKNFTKRVFYNYFLRDFSLASIELLLGLPMLVFGIIFGVYQWVSSLSTGIEASAGTVMLSALPIIIGMQFLLSFLQYDIYSTPREPLKNK